MEFIDHYEGVDELVAHQCFQRLESRFENIFCHGNTRDSLIPNSIFIYNRTGYKNTFPTKTIQLELDNSGNEGQRSVREESNFPVVFKNRGHFIAGYIPTDNVLVFCDITHEFNDFTIEVVNKVIDWIDTNYTIDKTLLEELLTPKKEIRVTIGKKVFTLKSINESTNAYEEFINKVTDKARDTILKIRTQYQESLVREKDRYEKLRKSVRPMPEIPYTLAMSQGLRISKVSNFIVYSFPITVICKTAVDEIAKKSIDIEEPKEYKGILHFYINETDIISQIRFTNVEGTGFTKHLHTLPDADICVGTTAIKGKKVKSVDEIVGFKNTLSQTLSVINIASCYHDSDRTLYESLRTKLTEAKTGSMGTGWTIRQPTPTPVPRTPVPRTTAG